MITIAEYVNKTMTDFSESGKPQFSAPLKVINANRYAVAWHNNQRLLAQMEYSCKKAQEIPDKETLRND